MYVCMCYIFVCSALGVCICAAFVCDVDAYVFVRVCAGQGEGA